MDINEQTDRWVEGEPVHNPDRDECCPDFSCCNPDLLAPKKEREEFAEAHYNNDTDTVYNYLFYFLGKMVDAKSSKKVHIAGEDDTAHDAEEQEESDSATDIKHASGDDIYDDVDHHEQMDGDDEDVP